jgi:23S rRNA pseudouridine1911/1915/1917 synthase
MQYQYSHKENSLTVNTGRSFRNQPVSAFLETCCLSRKDRYLLMAERRITCQGTIIRDPHFLLHENDELTIHFPAYEIDWAASDKAAEVLYENDFVLIVHKDPGMIIHSDKDDPDCLNGMVARYLCDHEEFVPVRPIHRLDEETAGLLLYVKMPFFQAWFDEQLRQRRISRHYLAISSGTGFPLHQPFIMQDPIGRDRHHNNVYRVSSTGREAVTRAECLAVRDGVSLIGCTLETGRTHQIRVHLSYHNAPIVNDVLYGHPDGRFAHMGLWADQISFHDPLSHKKHTIRDRQNPDYDFFPK